MGDTIIYVASNFFVAGIPFFLLPILTRYLPPSDYGSVAIFSITISFFLSIVGCNTHGALMLRIFDSRYRIPQYLTAIFFILMLTIFIAILFAFLFSNWLNEITSITLDWIILAIVVASLQFIVQLLLVFWQSTNSSLNYGALRCTQATMDLLFTLLFIVVFCLGWHGRVFGLGLAWFFAAIFVFYWLITKKFLVISINYNYVKDALAYGLPLVPHVLGSLVLVMSDRFIVAHYLNMESVGIYTLAVQVGLVLGMIADAINKVYAPWLMKSLGGINTSKKRSIIRYTYIYFIGILASSLILGLIAPKLLSIVINEKYEAAFPLVIYTLIGNAFTGMYYMVTNYIFFSGKTIWLSILTAIIGVSSVIINIFLIRDFGVIGAAKGYMIGQFMLFIGAWLIAHHLYPMPWLSAITKK